MKFGKLSSVAIIGCIAYTNPAWAQPINSIENICKVAPDGSVHTVKIGSLSSMISNTFFFTDMNSQQSFLRNTTAPFVNPRTFALNPGTYTVKFWGGDGSGGVVNWPNNLLVRPYTLLNGQCVINGLPKLGDKLERVPTTRLPR